MLNFIQDLSFFISLVICVVVSIKNTKAKKVEPNSWIEKYGNFLFLPIFFIAFVSISYKISEIPRGLHVDEAGAFYDAFCLSNYGVDRFLYKFPVYLINFGGGQSALYAYLAAILIKFFGMTILSFRLPAILLSLLSMICLFESIQKNNSKAQSLLTVLILAICPWNIMKSRWGLDCNLMSSLLIISLCFFMKAVRTNKNYLYCVTGILFGLTLYTYVISYLVVPILLGIFVLYLQITKKIQLKSVLCLFVPFGILALPLFLMILYNSGFIKTVNFPFFSIPKLWFFRGREISLKNIPENLKNIFEILFVKDFLNYNAIEIFGTLYKMSIPLVFFGLIEVAKNFIKNCKEKEFSLDFLMFITFLVVFCVGLCIAELNINKLNAIYIPMIYLVGKFLNYTFQNRKILSLVLVGLFLLNFTLFETYYFTEFANTDLFLFENNLMEISKKAETLNKDKIYVENQNYIYSLVATPISPYEFQENMKIENGNISQYGKYKFSIPDEIDKSAVYILKNDKEKMKQLISYEFEEQIYGEFYLFYYNK